MKMIVILAAVILFIADIDLCSGTTYGYKGCTSTLRTLNCPHGFMGLNCATGVDKCMCKNQGRFEILCQADDMFYCQCPDADSVGSYCKSKCAEYCLSCTINGPDKCDECAEGYPLRPDLTCTDDCFTGACQNGGTCIDGFNTYTCTCSAGFTGSKCETNINECSSSPCQNGGTCVDGDNGYACSCPAGYTGPNCQAYSCIIPDCIPGKCIPSILAKICIQCRPGYGTPSLTDLSRCILCSIKSGCAKCNSLAQCSQCNSASLAPMLDGSGRCAACALNCRRCTTNGPGKCDECSSGCTLLSDKTCAACAPNCAICTNNGPEKCDCCNIEYKLTPDNTCSKSIQMP